MPKSYIFRNFFDSECVTSFLQEDMDICSLVEKFSGKVRAYKPGSPGDKDRFISYSGFHLPRFSRGPSHYPSIHSGD
jgi:hypothetical protein